MAKPGKNFEPRMPKKVDHYVKHEEEGTQKALEDILEDKRQMNKKNKKPERKYKYITEEDTRPRREEAVRHTFQSVIEMYKMTEKTSSAFTTADVWASLNMYCNNTLELIDIDTSIVLGAVLWLLDHVEDSFQVVKLFDGIESDEGEILPLHYDLQHDSEVIEIASYVIKNRYAGDDPLLTLNTEPGETYDVFHQFMDLVDSQTLRQAIASFRTFFWKSVDCFFEAEYALGKRAVKAIEKYNGCIDVFNKQVDVLTSAIEAFKKWRDAPNKLHSEKKPLAGSPMMNVGANAPVNPFQGMPMTGPLADFCVPQDEPVRNMEQQMAAIDACSRKCEEQQRKTNQIINDIDRFAVDYSMQGFSFADVYLEHYEGAGLLIRDVSIEDPYALCAAIVLLCSPTEMKKLYEGVRGANLEKDLDLPWLTGAFCGVARDIAAQLPWGIQEYDEDEAEFRPPTKPLSHPDWYDRNYQRGDDFPRNLAQILYETTGAVLPRDMHLFDDAHKMLYNYGVRGKTELQMTELMTVMYDAQNRTHMLRTYTDQSEPAEDLEELKAQVERLQEQLKKVTDDAHALDRRARKAEQALQQEKTQVKADRQELAALREVLFKRENPDGSEETVSVALPCEVKKRVVVYGGHDSWLKGIKEYLTGDIRYIDRDQAIIDRNVIRNADVVWMQTNSLSHRQFYAIIDEVRKYGVPVRYFLYASAKKCAEQIALDEM